MIHQRVPPGITNPGQPWKSDEPLAGQWSFRPRWGSGFVLFLLLAVWALSFGAKPAYAQGGQVCRDEDNLTICGDEFKDFEQDLGIDGYRISGNVTIAPKGGAPVFRVTDASDIDLLDSPELRRARFEHVAEDRLSPYGSKNILFGDISFVNDPRQRTPLGTGGTFVDSANGQRGSTFAGVFWVDAVRQAIFPPAPAATRIYPTELYEIQAVLYNRLFLQHLALEAMYPDDVTLPEMSQFSAEYDVKNRQFFVDVTVPRLRLAASAENGNLPFTMRITMDDKGNYSGTATGFKLRMAGMTGDAKGIVVKPGEFEAASLEFSRADNPSLPNLDPTNPNLVFRLESLKYKDGHFAVGGVVGIKDWQLGNAMRMTNQSVGLFVDNVLKTTTIVISSTLTFPSRHVVTDGNQYPMRIEIGAQKLGNQFFPIGKGVLRNPNGPTLNMGPLGFGLPATTSFVFDPQRNFYGLEADKVTIVWRANLGGKSGVESTFKLGVNANRELIFLIRGGTVNLPELRTGALSAQLSGTIDNFNDSVTFKMKGTARLLLPGNTGVAPSAEVSITSGKNVCAKICSPTYHMKLAGFELKVAGFTLGLTNPRGTADGGFMADLVTLKVPAGITSFGGQVNGFKVTGTGDISVTGGSFELPPLQIGKISFVGIKGSFVKMPGGVYEFRGAGVMPLPGLDPSGGPAGKKVAVNIIVRTTSTGDFGGFGVRVDFNTGVPGIPIAGSGMELLAIGGSFDLTSGTAKIGVSMRAGTTARVGSLPIATINARSDLQINPFMLTANGELSILIFKVASASMGVGAGQGFNGGPGFNVSFDVNVVVVHGKTFLRVGQVTLSNGTKTTKFIAESTWALGIKKSQFGTLLPPRDFFLQKVSFKGGHFTHKSGKQVVGVMTTVGCCIFFKATVFADLSNGVDVSFINANDYKLIGAAQVRELAAAQSAGFSSQMVSAASVLGEEELMAAALSAEAMVLQEVIPVEISEPGSALFGISYPEGDPILRLQLPDGTTLSEETVDDVTSAFIRNTATITEPHEVAILLKDVEPGVYTLIIDNAPAEYEQVSYVLNHEPTLTDVTATCTGAPADGVTVTCNGAPAGATVEVNWHAADSDSEDAKVRVSFTSVLTDGISIDSTNQTFIVEDLPLGPGSATWALAEVPTGVYKVVVAVEDGQHAPVEVVTDLVIEVADGRAPAAPAGLQAQPLPGELLVTWTPNRERDLAGYEIGFGVVEAGLPDDPDRFVYLRDMGAKEVELPTGDVLDAKLWGLTDNQEVYVGIRAYDFSGNVSDWSPMLRAIPWALSPAAWTPVPNGASGTLPRIEVAFGATIITETLASAVSLTAADGVAVAGEVDYLFNLDEEVVGLSFTPATPLADEVEYTVMLKGGVEGIVARDGRTMAGDYSWRFTAVASLNDFIFLPLVSNQ
jgi:hypothetical protein